MQIPSWIFGETGYSFLDVWSFIHTSFWIFFGSLLWTCHLNRGERYRDYGYALALSLGWEGIEHFLAPRFPSIWFHPESWWNSWVSDPLTSTVGLFLVFRALDRWAR